ncbi:hypothetical protein GCM10009828_093080 [Actinoplanes couchii]|uniref:Uncharacterized protein n=1 Tax=Actinoplanes couchii TaxID=403638 RepID=A0ABQ3XTG9_9ACTN|nr:hypothetical protein Aco03nite_102210 [Actinoplanes couchii]
MAYRQAEGTGHPFGHGHAVQRGDAALDLAHPRLGPAHHGPEFVLEQAFTSPAFFDAPANDLVDLRHRTHPEDPDRVDMDARHYRTTPYLPKPNR